MAEGTFPKSDGDAAYASEFNGKAGQVINVEAGENITAGNVVYISRSDGEAYVSDINTAADRKAHGIALTTALAGADVEILTSGVYTTSGLTDKEQYYLSTSGALSATESAIFIGTALSTTELNVAIEESNLLQSQTISGAAVTDVTFSNLDINTDGIYLLECDIKRAGAGTADIFAYYEGDTTSSNYNGSYIIGDGATLTSATFNLAQIGAAGPGVDSVLSLKFRRTPSGYIVCEGLNIRNSPGSLINERWITTTDASKTNLTTLQITSSVASGIDIGSTFKLYKLTTHK